MAIKYSLVPNRLLASSNEYRAVVTNQRSYNREKLVDMMVARGSTVSKSDTLAVLAEYDAVRLEVLTRGGVINTPLMYMAPSIGGRFEGPSDRYHPSRHEVRMNAKPGSLANQITRDIPVRKVSPNQRYPVLKTWRDTSTDTLNKVLTPGGTGILNGRRLKIDPEDPEQGIFLITTASGSRQVIPITRILRNKPSELIFMIPDGLESGEYRMEVRTLIRHTSEFRTGRLDAPLTVT